MEHEIKTRLLAVVGALIILGTPLFSEGAQEDELRQWPESVAANNYKFCRIGNFETCDEGDWFGVYETELTGFALDQRTSTKFDPRVVMCKPISDPPSSDSLRVIVNKKYGVLNLCRLKSKQEILESFSKITGNDLAYSL